MAVGLELHLYLFVSHFELLTDCKAFNNPKSKSLAHIEHWNLRLQGYAFEVQHTKDNVNPSDYLSRHINLVGNNKQSTMAEEYMYLLTSLAVPKAKTLQEIQQATTKDTYNTVMLNALTVTRTQKWYNLDKLPEQFKDANITELRLFKQVKDDMTIND